MKIGIFGGCFNPPHKMHKDIALSLIRKKYVDKIIYVPTGDFYPKVDLISGKDRFHMLWLMTKGNDKTIVSDYELTKTSSTYQTLDYFKKQYPEDEVYFLCGSDNLKEIKDWENSKYILENYKIIVIKRNNDDLKELMKKYKRNKKRIIFPNIKYDNICSTELRKFIKNEDMMKIGEKIDKEVLDYIIKKQLYKTN